MEALKLYPITIQPYTIKSIQRIHQCNITYKELNIEHYSWIILKTQDGQSCLLEVIPKAFSSENENHIQVHPKVYEYLKMPTKGTIELVQSSYIHSSRVQKRAERIDFEIEQLNTLPIIKQLNQQKKEYNLSFFGERKSDPHHPIVRILKMNLIGMCVTNRAPLPIAILNHAIFIRPIQFMYQGSKTFNEWNAVRYFPLEKDKMDNLLITIQTPKETTMKEQMEHQVILEANTYKKEKLDMEERLKQSLTSSLATHCLLPGLSGVGKTHFLKSMAYAIQKAMPNVQIEWNIHQMILNPIRHKHTLCLMDDLHFLAHPAREDIEQEKQLQRIRHFLDQTEATVLATVNDESALDSSVFRRFGTVINLPIPHAKDREAILLNLQKHFNSTLDENQMKKAIQHSAGYVARDLQKVMSFVGRKMKIEDALHHVQPSTTIDQQSMLRRSKPPKLNFEKDIAGYASIKANMKRAFYGELNYPKAYESVGLKGACSGMLLHGPTGVGKTLLLRGLASLGEMIFIEVRCTELFSKYTGETEAAIRRLFQRARQLSPCVLVFDEIDAFSPNRDTLSSGGESDSGAARHALTQLLTELDGIEDKRQVRVLASTNRLSAIDPAIIRPGRLDILIEVPLPSPIDRQAIIENVLQTFKLIPNETYQLSEKDMDKLVELTQGYSGADLYKLVKETCFFAHTELPVCLSHFEHILSSK